MKIKRLIIFLTPLIILFIIVCCNNAQRQNNSNLQDEYSEEQIKEMLKCFYTSYITETSKFPSNPAKEDSIRMVYCTTNMLKVYELPELDYDPIIKGQMVLKECLETLTIRKDSNSKDIYFVSYNWPLNDKELITIKLRVIKETTSYKVDYIFLLP
jgi:hypothetical protein